MIWFETAAAIIGLFSIILMFYYIIYDITGRHNDNLPTIKHIISISCGLLSIFWLIKAIVSGSNEGELFSTLVWSTNSLMWSSLVE